MSGVRGSLRCLSSLMRWISLTGIYVAGGSPSEIVPCGNVVRYEMNGFQSIPAKVNGIIVSATSLTQSPLSRCPFLPLLQVWPFGGTISIPKRYYFSRRSSAFRRTNAAQTSSPSPLSYQETKNASTANEGMPMYGSFLDRE